MAMARLVNEDGSETMVHADPWCGVDFCDWCGDCLACYGDGSCPNGAHQWVVYPSDVPAFWRDHPEAGS
jgi:hypothetical protein